MQLPSIWHILISVSVNVCLMTLHTYIIGVCFIASVMTPVSSAASASDSLLPIVQSQRERFRVRAQELETVSDGRAQELETVSDVMTQELETVSASPRYAILTGFGILFVFCF